MSGPNLGGTDLGEAAPAHAHPIASRDDFRTLADSIPQLTWIADGVGHIFWYNRRWYDYTGTTLEEMAGWGWRQVHHPNHIDGVIERFKAAIQTGDAWEDTFPLRRADGVYRWFLSRALPQRDGEGRVVRWFGTNTDITEQRDADEALRRSEARFRTLVDAAADIIWSTTADGVLLPPQEGWTRFTGQSGPALAVTGWLDAVHPDDQEMTLVTWRDAVANGARYHVEHRVRRRDGEYRHMEVSAVPVINAIGEIVEWVGIHTDVTARRAAAAEVEAARDAAEAANRAKSQFIANMSHELRTPLSAVIGYSEMVAEEVEDLGHPDLVRDMGKIQSSARHLLNLINDVLDLSKIEAGRMTVSRERFAVSAMLGEVTEAAGALMAKKRNTLQQELAPGLGEMLSDDLKIRQCLLNLLGNAAKFTEDGTITLRAHREDREGAAWLVFAVADTGIGMSEEQVGRLFQRFSQADESTTRQFGGTGLGLAITRAFCRKLGGDVAVDSIEGEGTTFTISLPAELPEDTQDIEAPAEAARGQLAAPRNNTVLVVDDDPSARELLSRFLAREGFSVHCEANGLAGLERARALRPMAVILDVEMPQMNGWAVLHAIRSDPALAHTPVIMASVVNEQSLGYALGATDYLVKPIQWNTLKGAIARLRVRSETGAVLLVDDDADARERLRTMLAREGWTVTEAENGREAVARVEASMPALVLLDLMMPVMDGFEFLQVLRTMPAGQGVPVVVLTAKDMSTEELNLLATQADRIVRKGSLSLADLVRELNAIVPPDQPNGCIDPPPSVG
jgi:PAS domain S-box-containing protein